METLPVEMIQHIMCCENLSINDVVNFSLTNRYNYLVVTNCNRIWKKEYFKTWPQFVELFDNKFSYHWYAEVQYMYDLKRRTDEILSAMPSRFCKVNNVLSNSDFTEWSDLYQEKPLTYYYLIDDLMNIVNTNVPIESIDAVPIITPGNKTLQYYALKVLRYLRHLHLTKEWETFMTLPQKLQTLEKGIVFVGQWFHPNSVFWNNIAAELDELTEEVKKSLKGQNPNHPLFFVPKEQLEIWRNENIECDKYDSSHCMQIKCVMADVVHLLIKKSFIFKNTFLTVEKIIGNVVHTAIFLILYESIARRLGVKFEPIVVAKRLYLRSLKSNDPEEHQYIDFYNCCYGSVSIQCQPNFSVATMQQVFKLIAKEVEVFSGLLASTITGEMLYSRLKFLELVSPFDVSIKHDLASLYMQYNMNATSYIEALLEQKNQAPEEIEPIINMLQQYQTDRNDGDRLFRKVEPKVRPTNLKYAIGMVMIFSRHVSYFLCLICDWDCSASDEEPFYTILLAHGSYLNVPQSNLRRLPCIRSSPSLMRWCFNDIDVHFSHRFEAVFVPNAVKELEYPADSAVRKEYNEQLKLKV